MSSIRFILAILSCIFLIYSSLVFTDGTDYSLGIELYNAESKEGKKLFQEKNCISCHQVYGLGGYMGPDLTNIISQRNNNESIARAFLKNGTQKMPDFKLTDREIDALIAYLKYLDKTGKYPLNNYEITTLGTVEENKTE